MYVIIFFYSNDFFLIKKIRFNSVVATPFHYVKCNLIVFCHHENQKFSLNLLI